MRGSKSLLKLETKETEKCVEEYTSLFSDVFCEKCVDEVTEKCVAEKVAKNLHTEMSVLGLFLLPLKKNGQCSNWEKIATNMVEEFCTEICTCSNVCYFLMHYIVVQKLPQKNSTKYRR